MVTEADVRLPGGRVLHAYDTRADGISVFWLHGSPNIGSPPEPLFAAVETILRAYRAQLRAERLLLHIRSDQPLPPR